MTMRALHRWALTLAAALPIAGVMNGSTLLAIAGAVLLSVLVLRGGQLGDVRRSMRLTAIVHTLTAGLLVAAIVLFPRARIDAVLMVVMIGIFNRWVLRAGHRDDLIILGASAVLLAAATTITPGIAFAVIIVGYIAFSMWAMFAALVLSLAEREATDEARRAAWQRLGNRPVGRLLGRIAVLSILFTVIGSSVMLFFPRYHFARFLSVGAFMNLPGQSDEMELRTDGVPSPGGGWVAMRVEPSPGRSPSSLEGMYALIAVLDEFDGKRWRARIEQPSRELYLYPPDQLYRGPKEAFSAADGPNTLRVTLFRRVAGGQPHPVATLGRDRPGYVAMFAVRQQENGNIVRGGWPGTQLMYKVDPDRSYQTVEVPDWETRFLQLPDDLDPRVRELAARLTAGLTDDRAKVNALLSYFARERFRYSLDPLAGESDDPLVRFLFEAKQGHCELYAGALAVLLRAAGVKARVATGYYGGWWNSLGGYLELADVDGHAWVEAYYDGAWRWVDATPEDRRARREEKTFAWIFDAYDALEAFWHDNVLAFDENERRELMTKLSATWAALSGDGSDWFGGGSKGGGSGTTRGAPLIAIALLAGCVAIAWALARRIRNRRPEVLGLRLRRALGGEGNATLGRLLSGVAPDARAIASEAVARYERFRFGNDGDPADVLAAIRALERALR